ncbi:glycosyltransferase involved in cell wall biosynthesis [Variovorax boronicumulans]|uniref:glycosyltransferase family 4 protein n=1 Tax=Variovorax boronicumulans TaxID=436515 RepID=UPI0027800697|nr:glycosyltransferase family 4 protein [Variovorax boronicumulans]MDQ0072570.1 glycosyltransferase involved in cell wall biosynthesis [Variovorax boronicumulans]
MRLLVVSQYFWPENFRINDLVAEFVRRGHQVTVLTGVPNYPDGKVFPAYREDPERFARYEGAEVVRVPMSARGKGGIRLMLNFATFAISASVLGLWKLRGRDFDAVLAYEPSPITVGVPAVALRAVKRAPLVFWVLDLWPETLEAIGVVRSPFILRSVGRLVSFIYKRCDLILAQSKSFVPQIKKYAGNSARVEYFPSWAEMLFDVDQAVAAPEVQVQPESFNVMFAGNIGDAQDFPAILAAAEILKEHRNIRWLIVGDGRMAQWVADEIQRRGLQESVHMLGRHPVERMSSFFKHADALLVSLKSEPIFSMTIPGKLQSYLAAGVPVLAMLNGEGADVVRNAAAGLTCNAGDHKELAKAVLELSKKSAEERRAMGANGLALSASEFERGSLINRLEGWLQSLSFPASATKKQSEAR